jgi:D-beta-D-heptose 7-phosphate kinase/D-beta-D-heptose 1-phosphate adenosyltransferase
LLTARAIESQSFVVAASGSTERPGACARGGSIVIGPGGVVLARGGSDDEIVVASLDLDEVNEVRRSRPLARRRVPAAYAEAIASAPLSRSAEEEASVPTLGRILSRDDMARESVHLHAQGRSLVFTNGCFDILHLGHVRYLEDARRLGDALCVGLNTDASVRRLGKAPDRPIQSQDDRAAILASLRCVDYVVLFDEPTPLELIRAVQPDVLVKGGDWKPENVVGADVVTARGGRVVIAEFVAGHSTTGVVERIRASVHAERVAAAGDGRSG